ncbi:MAG: DUF2752 domain-containing protein [Clostridium sp.]|nr:DUF2752 domain-containing protein [Clostridium sp.]
MKYSKNTPLVFILILLLSIWIFLKDPATVSIFPCVFNKITGLYCPGCGITRALHCLFHFRFYQAFRYNALIIIFPPFFLLYLFLRYKKKYIFTQLVVYTMLTLAICYGIARNIPALSYLKPTPLQ